MLYHLLFAGGVALVAVTALYALVLAGRWVMVRVGRPW